MYLSAFWLKLDGMISIIIASDCFQSPLAWISGTKVMEAWPIRGLTDNRSHYVPGNAAVGVMGEIVMAPWASQKTWQASALMVSVGGAPGVAPSPHNLNNL